MLPYLIAGAIGFVVGKLLEEDETPKYADGGLIAPNGKPSNLTYSQYKLVRTQAFKDWFGEWENDPANASKVVDENGEPLVCYHTTDYLEEIHIFNFSEEYDFQQYGFGVYFTDDKKHSESYFEGEKYKIYQVFLNLKNPIILNQKEKGSNKKSFLINREENNKAGAIIYHPDRRKWNYFIAGEPNQIKLADGTNTTFDGNNPDIRFDKGGLIAPNGKQSNLTPEQYRLVRTQAFKDWFGDWEKGVFTDYQKLVEYKHKIGTGASNIVSIDYICEEIDLDKAKTIKSFHKKAFEFLYSEYESANKNNYQIDFKNFIIKFLIMYKPVFDLVNQLTSNEDIEITKKTLKEFHEKNFQEWVDYKNKDISKVVDENGEPLVVWRGVRANNYYEYQKKGYVYFAKNKSYAPIFGDTLYPFFLNIRNPLDLEFFNKISSENGLTSFNNEGLFQIGKTQLNNQFENELDLLYMQNLNDVYTKFNYLFKNGDGIVGYDIGSYGEELVFVTKQPNQIKLADGTNTTFDSNNNDIRFDGGGGIDYYEELKPEFDYYSVNYDDMNGKKFRDNIFDTLTEAKALFNKLCVTGKTFERVDINTIELVAFYENGLYEVLDSKAFINTYPKFLNNLQIEDGSKYIGQKFTDVFPYLKRSDFTPYKFKIKVKRYNNILRRLSEDNYSTKYMKTADLNRLEKIEPTIEKVKYLSKFFCDNSKTILSFDNSDNAYAGGGKVQPKDLT